MLLFASVVRKTGDLFCCSTFFSYLCTVKTIIGTPPPLQISNVGNSAAAKVVGQHCVLVPMGLEGGFVRTFFSLL